MTLVRRGAVLAFVGLSVPSLLFGAPSPNTSATPKESTQTPQAAVEGGTSSSVVTEEMRSANESASSSADAAIASLKAARAAIAAEKSREGTPAGAGAGGGGATASLPPAALPSPPAGPVKKGKAVEKLDPLPGKQDLPHAAPVSAPLPVKPASNPASAAAVKADVSNFKAAIEEEKPTASKDHPTKLEAGTAGSSPASQPTAQSGSEPKPKAQTAPLPAPPAAQGAAADTVKAPAPAAPAGDAPPSIEAAAASAAAALGSGSPAAGEPATGEVKKKSRFGSDDALGDASKKKGKGKGKEAVKLTPEQQKAAEIKAFCDKARDAIKRGEEEVARGLLESLVAVDLPHAEKKVALSEVATVYEEKGDLTKAIAILEKLTTILDGDTEVPVWLLKLAQLYREAGAYQMAISRYYGVIQLAMKVGSSDFQKFQAISRQAQREIANTYFMKGDFDQAQKFYNMALRSDLPKDERAVALFRSAHCTFMRNDMNGAINALERFLKDFSRHASAAEARYMLATAYRVEGRPQDAYDSVIDLLRDVKGKAEENPKAWAFWQKKAGNEFANDYYQRGEFVNAVTIYQSLAAIEDSPEWRWPVVYQMGLCFERLRIEPRAAECYKYIVEENKKPEFRWKKMPQSVANLVQMAAWRVDQLDWDGKFRSKLRAVAGSDLNRPLPKGLRP